MDVYFEGLESASKDGDSDWNTIAGEYDTEEDEVAPTGKDNTEDENSAEAIGRGSRGLDKPSGRKHQNWRHM